MPHDGRIFVRSRRASRIDLCLFDSPDDAKESRRIPLVRDGDVWTSETRLAHGQAYALRADGPMWPEARARFFPERLLLDPYARAIGRSPAPLDPLGVIVSETFDWQGDRAPGTAWRDTVIYEAHVKGLTITHPDVPAAHRGTFLGVTAPAVIAHLKALGVTAIELLPIHARANEDRLRAMGLTNYWGYNTLSYFAPDPRFATDAVRTDPTAAVRECRTMIRELHRAGIEVILDVVYNHSAEGPVEGPTLSLRGLDPLTSYRRRADDPSQHEDWTGCGNTLNLDHPDMRALVIDSLRYWADDMHVDGFRFDLASALDRAPGTSGSLFRELQDDPLLAGKKMIVEPWDATPHGYRLGGFLSGVAEWNGRYRDATRRFWRGDAGVTPEFATRFCGSEDLFGAPGRSPIHSINFVTSHDGFTLADLVSYADKHNEANGEGNRDGESQNFSSNAGQEGPTDDAAVLAERATRQRSLLATLAFSLGVPMLSGGDELGRTQLGNNNAYCQDGPLSWTAWPGDTALRDFTRRIFALRHAHRALTRDRFLTDADVKWLDADGQPLTPSAWHDADRRLLGICLRGDAGPDVLIYVNAGAADTPCRLPDARAWRMAIDTSAAVQRESAAPHVVNVGRGALVCLISAS